MKLPLFVLTAALLAISLTACPSAGGTNPTTPTPTNPGTGSTLTLSDAYDSALNGAVNLSSAIGTNTIEAGFPNYCNIKYTGVKVAALGAAFTLSMIYDKATKVVYDSALFGGGYTLTLVNDAAKVTVDTAKKTATFNAVVYGSGASDRGTLNGVLNLPGNAQDAACGAP
jgi:hypothetical protein